jgi:PAS domain S-box-containing protein
MTGWIRQTRTWAVLLLAGSLMTLGGTSFVRRVVAVQPEIGIEWTTASAGPVAVLVAANGPAARAGLREGDVLLAVDGRRVTSALEARDLGWSAAAGSPVTLRVRRGGSELALQVRADWAPRREPYGYLVIVGLAFWVSGLFIALRWPRIRGGAVYLALAACLFGHLTLSRTGRGDVLDWAVDWLDAVSGALWPAVLLHLVLAVTRRALRFRRAAIAGAYAASAALVGGMVWLSPAALGGAYRAADPVHAVELWSERAGYLFVALAVGLAVAVLLKSHARSSSATHRSQMRWMLWGLSVGFGPFVVLYAVPWSLGAAELPEWACFLAVVPMLIVPATFTAALARYRLYDLDVFLVRGAAEVTAVFSVAAVLAVTVFVLREGLGGLFPLSRSATRYMGFLAAAVAYPKLRQWSHAAVERAFYRRRYSYRATLLDWARELSAETDLAALLHHLRRRVRETLGVAEAEVLLRAGDRRFERVDPPLAADPFELDADTLARLEQSPYVAVEMGGVKGLPWARYLYALKVKGSLRAVLAIAERSEPEEPLSTEDRTLLGTLAAHAATAIEAARLVLEVRRRAAEIERLHTLQARILESSAVGLLLLDGDGQVLAWNRALEEICGLARAEALGRRLGEIFPLHVGHRITREGDLAARKAEPRSFRLNMTSRAGSHRTVNVAVSAVSEGQLRGAGGLVVTFDDVTERVQLEEQLVQQERLASLGLLAAGVAHEINTPLTGISSYAQLLLEDAAGGPRRDLLTKIEAQTRRASEIANSLLNLARPERIPFEALDVNAAVREVLALFAPQVRGGGVRLEARLEEGLPPVHGHRGKLQQLLLNLLLNARDAVGQQGNITVSTRLPGGAERIVIEVADDGVGISEDDLPRIFDPFFTTKGRGKGTGLGLSISYGIVREHRGEIRAERAGGWTRFRVELPAVGQARAMAK